MNEGDHQMAKRLAQTLWWILSGILLLSGGVSSVSGQEYKDTPGEPKTLTGRIRWSRDMGVLPSAPGSTTAAKNICAHFFVVAVRPEIGDTPIAYDNTLEAKPDITKPDLYACAYEMKVPSGVRLLVYAGMGDALAWPKTEKVPFHYTSPWIVDGRLRRGPRTMRVFTPAVKTVVLRAKGMYLPFDLGWEM
jgi:hypothetical protein